VVQKTTKHYHGMPNIPIVLALLLKIVTLSDETVLASNSFHKSTTLALKNFYPNVPFLFINTSNVYLCPELPCLVLTQRTSPNVLIPFH